MIIVCVCICVCMCLCTRCRSKYGPPLFSPQFFPRQPPLHWHDHCDYNGSFLRIDYSLLSADHLLLSKFLTSTTASSIPPPPYIPPTQSCCMCARVDTFVCVFVSIWLLHLACDTEFQLENHKGCCPLSLLRTLENNNTSTTWTKTHMHTHMFTQTQRHTNRKYKYVVQFFYIIYNSLTQHVNTLRKIFLYSTQHMCTA